MKRNTTKILHNVAVLIYTRKSKLLMQTTTIVPTLNEAAKLDVTDAIHNTICDEDSCLHEASSFESDRVIFVCREHESRQEIERLRTQLAALTEVKKASGTIECTPCTVPFPDGLAPGYTIEVMAAGNTGLGYVKCLNTYTIAHIPTQDLLIFNWFAESEELARKWIDELVALADWTDTIPKFREADCLKGMIAFACIGILTEGDLSVRRISSPVL
jgi:hypothetical protein